MIQDYGFRLYNPAIGKFLSVDPLAPDYPAWGPYAFAMNSPIAGIDLDGLEFYYSADGSLIGKYGTSTEVRVVKESAVKYAKNTLDKGDVLHAHWYEELKNADGEPISHDQFFKRVNYAIGESKNATEYYAYMIDKYAKAEGEDDFYSKSANHKIKTGKRLKSRGGGEVSGYVKVNKYKNQGFKFAEGESEIFKDALKKTTKATIDVLRGDLRDPTGGRIAWGNLDHWAGGESAIDYARRVQGTDKGDVFIVVTPRKQGGTSYSIFHDITRDNKKSNQLTGATIIYNNSEGQEQSRTRIPSGQSYKSWKNEQK